MTKFIDAYIIFIKLTTEYDIFIFNIYEMCERARLHDRSKEKNIFAGRGAFLFSLININI
nr:MAG TPA_asm: hypothetical protein [Caudoviricetes sp.]